MARSPVSGLHSYPTSTACSKRAPATVNAARAAVSDLALRRGLGKLDGTVGLDLDDLPTTQRRRRLRIHGEGRRNRSVPVHAELARYVSQVGSGQITQPGKEIGRNAVVRSPCRRRRPPRPATGSQRDKEQHRQKLAVVATNQVETYGAVLPNSVMRR